jgi:hypothetical protein
MHAPACGAAATYFRRKTSARRTYLQIVESRRDGDQARQQQAKSWVGGRHNAVRL